MARKLFDDIIFRGIGVSDNLWHYGLPTLSRNSSGEVEQLICTREFMLYKVKPETLGEAIGVESYDHKNIYEGDVVKVWRHQSGYYIAQVGAVRFRDYDSHHNARDGYSPVQLHLEQLEIVGDIYHEPFCDKPIAQEMADDAPPAAQSDAISDAVNHPQHYQMGGVEVIDAIEAWGFGDGFNRGNAIKYIARAGRKSKETELEDLKKARFYIEREIERLSRD